MLIVGAPGLMMGGRASSVAELGCYPTRAATGSRHVRWLLHGPGGQKAAFAHQPRLICAEAKTLRDAALAGLGIALLPEPMCATDIRRGALIRLLPEWEGPVERVEVLFTSRRAMLPSVRALIDHLAGAFARASFRQRALPERSDILQIVGF